MVEFLRALIDVAMCCVLHSRVSEPGNKNIQHAATMLHLKKMLDPIKGSPAAGKHVAGFLDFFVDDPFGTGGSEMEHRVLARLRKDFQVGSQDWNDVTFTRQRIRSMKDP